MRIRAWVWRVLFVVLFCVIFFVVVGALTGHPLFLGYVETASMDPTIAPGEGFVALSPMVTPPPSQGDIIVFESQTDEVDLVVHRIVGRTEEGFITQGDNNPFTDQDRGEPPVPAANVAGQPLVVRGTVVTVPGYGPFTVAVQSWLQAVVVALGLGRYPGATITVAVGVIGVSAISVSVLAEVLTTPGRETTRAPTRPTVDSRLVLLIVLVIVAVPVTTFMTLPSETTEITILSAPYASGPGVFEPGEAKTTAFSVENTQFVPKVIILESQGTGVEFSTSVLTVNHGQTATTNLTVTAPPTEGTYVRVYSQHHYPRLLPVGVIYRLHAVSPAVATGVLTGIVLGGVTVGFWLRVGFRALTLRPSSR